MKLGAQQNAVVKPLNQMRDSFAKTTFSCVKPYRKGQSVARQPVACTSFFEGLVGTGSERNKSTRPLTNLRAVHEAASLSLLLLRSVAS
jgi:hypothetical protein